MGLEKRDQNAKKWKQQASPKKSRVLAVETNKYINTHGKESPSDAGS